MRKNKLLFIIIMMTFCLWMGTPAKAAPSINAKKIHIKNGRTYRLKVRGIKGKVSWKSSNKKVATVNKYGLVKTKATGAVRITGSFKYKGKKKKFTSRVRVYHMDTETVTFAKGSTFRMNIIGTTKETWKSSDPLIASVSRAGRVKGLRAGSCTITGSINGLTFKRKVKVAGFKEDPIILAETGAPYKLSMINAPGTKVYTTSNEQVARIENNQLIPVDRGTCTITAMVGGNQYHCAVRITAANPTLFISNLETYHQFIMAHPNQFRRHYDSSLKSFDTVKERVAQGELLGITCVVPCRWALYALGVKRADGKSLLSCNDGTFKGQYTGGMVDTFEWIQTGNVVGLNVKEAVDQGLLKKGDIIGFKDKTHTFVYSGKGYMVYEGGNDCTVDGHYPNGIMRNYGITRYRLEKCKISEIMRWKK